MERRLWEVIVKEVMIMKAKSKDFSPEHSIGEIKSQKNNKSCFIAILFKHIIFTKPWIMHSKYN